MVGWSTNNGYNTYEGGKDFKFSLGTDESIETAMAFNKAWDERDFETMGELSATRLGFIWWWILRNLDWVKGSLEGLCRATNGATWMQNLSMSIPSFNPKWLKGKNTFCIPLKIH